MSSGVVTFLRPRGLNGILKQSISVYYGRDIVIKYFFSRPSHVYQHENCDYSSVRVHNLDYQSITGSPSINRIMHVDYSLLAIYFIAFCLPYEWFLCFYALYWLFAYWYY